MRSFLTSSGDHCGSGGRDVSVVGAHHIVATVAIATQPSTHTAAGQDDNADYQPEGRVDIVNW